MRIVLDCAHGAAYKVAPAVFEELGAEVIRLGVSPDGTNINAGCGSLYPEVVAQAVKKYGADVGIALDGDADRVIFVDENGDEVDGDHIMAICAAYLHEQGELAHDTLVTTVMSNMGLDLAMQKLGINVVKTAVGDRYVHEQMLEHGYNFGGEQSGHMIFSEYSTTGDGTLTALQVLRIIREKNKTLSELAAAMTALPQVLLNVRVAQRKDISQIRAVQDVISKCEEELGDKGRLLIRYSGTEPLLRIMLEGPNRERIEAMADEIAAQVIDSLGGQPK
ncbi:MAG: phosphoglucosamine mutase, partial [Desulfuromonas sp.]|nr:phosphoglucosamine mutase [Desulfuromonas sp.]